MQIISCKWTTLPLESWNKCFTNVFNIVDEPASNLLFFLKSRIFKQLLISCFNWSRFFFLNRCFKKYCVTVMEIWYDQVNSRSVLFWIYLSLSFGEGKRRLHLNHFGKCLQIIRAARFHFKIVRSYVKCLAESQTSEENAVRLHDSGNSALQITSRGFRFLGLCHSFRAF